MVVLDDVTTHHNRFPDRPGSPFVSVVSCRMIHQYSSAMSQQSDELRILYNETSLVSCPIGFSAQFCVEQFDGNLLRSRFSGEYVLFF